MMTIIYVGLLILCFIIEGVEAEICFDTYRYSFNKYFSCTDCCGYFNNQYCCTNAGLIAGAVIGGLIGLSIIIALIILCVKKSGNTTGRVIPSNQGGVNVIQTSQQQAGSSMYPPPHGGHPQYGQYPPPGQYNPQHGQYPPPVQHNPQYGQYPSPGQVPQPPAYTADPPPFKQ